MAATDIQLTVPARPSPVRGRPRRLLAHLPFALLLLAGAVLRLMTWGAYRPALLFPDSRVYLLGAADEQLKARRPGGYSVFLWPFLHLHLGGLPSISLAQHLLGLAMAAAVYLLLLRLGVWPWLAALATAPLLLDSMQLSLEQYVMSDLPLAAYMTTFHHQSGNFAMTTYSSRFLYARLAPIADCRGLALPPSERSLCPPEPPDQRMASNAYMWDLRRSPQYQVSPPAGKTVQQVLADFDRRVILHQPVDYALLVGRDVLRRFQPFRTVGPKDVAPTPWLLRRELPSNGSGFGPDQLYRSFGYGPVLDRPLAGILARYQHVGHTPGPVLAACAVAARLAAAGVGRVRRSGCGWPPGPSPRSAWPCW